MEDAKARSVGARTRRGAWGREGMGRAQRRKESERDQRRWLLEKSTVEVSQFFSSLRARRHSTHTWVGGARWGVGGEWRPSWARRRQPCASGRWQRATPRDAASRAHRSRRGCSSICLSPGLRPPPPRQPPNSKSSKDLLLEPSPPPDGPRPGHLRLSVLRARTALVFPPSDLLPRSLVRMSLTAAGLDV